MKKITISLAVISLALFGYGCKKDKTETPVTPTTTTTPPVSTDITYNAAFVVNGGGNSISVIDLSNNEVKRTLSFTNITYPHHLALNSSKGQIAIGVPGMDLSGGHSGGMHAMGGKIVIVDAKTGNELKRIELPMANHNAAFSPDGSEIWTSQMDTMGTVLIYDASTYILKKTINVGMMPAEVTFSFDGKKAFVANGGSDNVTVIDVVTKAVVKTITVGAEPVGAWTASNNKMYVDNEMGKSISIIDVGTLAVEETISLGFMPGIAAYNANMTQLWVSDPDGGKVHVYEKMGGMYMEMGNVITGAGAHAIAFNKDGMIAYVTNQMVGTVSVIDVMNKTKTKDITVGNKPNGILLKLDTVVK
jgi:YVTN family beta-propeller protein